MCQLAVQLPSQVELFRILWTAACQASLSLTISWSLPKFMSTESPIPSNHLILCCPLLFYLQSFPASGSFPMKSVRLAFLNYKSNQVTAYLRLFLICPRLLSPTSNHTIILLLTVGASLAFFLQILRMHPHFRVLALTALGTTSFEPQPFLL